MGYYDYLRKLLRKGDTRENQKPLTLSPLASYDPTFPKTAIPKVPDLRLNDFGLASIGGNPVQLEQNPLNPPSMVMPTAPGLEPVGTPPMMPENDGERKTGSLAANLLKGLALAGVAGAVGGPIGVQSASAIAGMVAKIKAQKERQKSEQARADAKAKAEQKKSALEERRVINEEKRVKDWKESADKTAEDRRSKQSWENTKDMVAGIRDTFLGKPGTQKILTPEESARIESQTAANKALEKQRQSKMGFKPTAGKASGDKAPKESANTATLSDGTKLSFGQYKLMPIIERQKVKDLFVSPNQAFNWDATLSGQSPKGNKSPAAIKDKEIERIDREIEKVNLEKETAPRIMASQGAQEEAIQAKHRELNAKLEGLQAAKQKKTGVAPKKNTFETIMKSFEAFKKEAQ